ncbi:AAA family ATPase [Methyloversatilis sp. XJ19-13]|uniref:AAA family ATPase n=1 Tax=Methyloversatilis sp. XJ19-13 TaxID=2963430 RepID=UPI00211B77BE|nr:AAA family ATPase [Methyloversatilis sp. XJ19-13]MCQ9375933.1 AAA family ATPase [Methyloversatilis sp. XJ19-13]
MRLENLRLRNFRGFNDRAFHFHPEFNLIVGENGAGKTSVLEAAAVAIASWLLGIRGHDARNIRKRDIRVIRDEVEGRYRELPQYPVSIDATGYIEIARAAREKNGGEVLFLTPENPSKPNPREQRLTWSRSLESADGRTTRSGAGSLKTIASKMEIAALNRQPYVLPLLRYFSAGRLWESVRDTDKRALSKHKGKQPAELAENADEIDRYLFDRSLLSEPFYGYRMSVDGRCNPSDLIRWMAFERRNEMEDGNTSTALALVYKAVGNLMPEAATVRYSGKLETLVLHKRNGQELTFEELSDGYRNIVAIVADLAIKAAMLNPQLAEKALELTPGVVLIDELDLHLHPRWQRRVIEDLRRTFPKVQFICTTHSPFLIQSLRSGEELIVMDGQPTANLSDMSVEEIARGIMGVTTPQVSARYDEMKDVAFKYLETLEEAAKAPAEKLAEYKERLATSVAPYADNPAFQAFLEMKRAAKLGE